jgi:hypothetical protein
MRDRSTTALIHELSSELEPVRPIPRLREVAAAFTGLWLVNAAFAAWLRGPRPDLMNVFLHGPGYTVVMFGLCLVAIGGVMAGLAFAVPGREGVWRSGLMVLAAGGALGVIPGALLAIYDPLPGTHPCELGTDLRCLTFTVVRAVFPCVALVAFLRRSNPERPSFGLAAMLIGSLAGAAMLSHLVCGESMPRHVVLTHALGPVAVGAALAAPLALADRFGSGRLGRRFLR